MIYEVIIFGDIERALLHNGNVYNGGINPPQADKISV